MSGRVFHRRLGHDYPVVVRAEGVYLYDTEGRRYLDASGGALVVNAGHGMPEISSALARQARVDDGIAWKGRRTRMRGAVNLIQRRTSHITVVVEEA